MTDTGRAPVFQFEALTNLELIQLARLNLVTGGYDVVNAIHDTKIKNMLNERLRRGEITDEAAKEIYGEIFKGRAWGHK